MTYTSNQPDAETSKKTQYFGFMGSQGVYPEGWFAETFGPRAPWSTDMAGVINWEPEIEAWELYNLDKDYSQSKDIAKENPKKMAKLKS